MFLFKRKGEAESDEDLLRQYLRSGDAEYFGILYNRYIPLV